jgi:hypothetical protein
MRNVIWYTSDFAFPHNREIYFWFHENWDNPSDWTMSTKLRDGSPVLCIQCSDVCYTAFLLRWDHLRMAY